MDVECGPSGPLQQFKQQTSVDRTLQQDRLSSRRAPTQGFRSHDPNAALLDPEFEAFQAGLPAPNLPQFQSFLPHQQPSFAGPSRAAPSWAQDFQRMAISPPPMQQQYPINSGPRTAGWAQGFQQSLAQSTPRTQQTSSPLAFQQRARMGYGGFQSQFTPRPSLVQQSKGKEPVYEEFDDAAFEQAFAQARDEMEVDEAGDIKDPAHPQHPMWQHVAERDAGKSVVDDAADAELFANTAKLEQLRSNPSSTWTPEMVAALQAHEEAIYNNHPGLRETVPREQLLEDEREQQRLLAMRLETFEISRRAAEMTGKQPGHFTADEIQAAREALYHEAPLNDPTFNESGVRQAAEEFRASLDRNQKVREAKAAMRRDDEVAKRIFGMSEEERAQLSSPEAIAARQQLWRDVLEPLPGGGLTKAQEAFQKDHMASLEGWMLNDLRGSPPAEEVQEAGAREQQVREEQAPATEQQLQEEQDALASTAQELLSKVEGNTTEKFRNSQFLGLMRKLRDREMKVVGDKMVETTATPTSTSTAQTPLTAAPMLFDNSEQRPSPLAGAVGTGVPLVDTRPPDYGLLNDNDADLGRIDPADGQGVRDILDAPQQQQEVYHESAVDVDDIGTSLTPSPGALTPGEPPFYGDLRAMHGARSESGSLSEMLYGEGGTLAQVTGESATGIKEGYVQKPIRQRVHRS